MKIIDIKKKYPVTESVTFACDKCGIEVDYDSVTITERAMTLCPACFEEIYDKVVGEL